MPACTPSAFIRSAKIPSRPRGCGAGGRQDDSGGQSRRRKATDDDDDDKQLLGSYQLAIPQWADAIEIRGKTKVCFPKREHKINEDFLTSGTHTVVPHGTK